MMDLRITGSAYAEVGAAFLEVADKVGGVVVVPAFSGGKVCTLRNIPSQGHDVFYSGVLYLLYPLAHRLSGGRYAGQVLKDRYIVGSFDILYDIKGVPAGAAACSVSDAHKCGLERGDLFGGGLYALK